MLAPDVAEAVRRGHLEQHSVRARACGGHHVVTCDQCRDYRLPNASRIVRNGYLNAQTRKTLRLPEVQLADSVKEPRRSGKVELSTQFLRHDVVQQISNLEKGLTLKVGGAL